MSSSSGNGRLEYHLGFTVLLGARLVKMATRAGLSFDIALSELADGPLSVQASTLQKNSFGFWWADSSFVSFHQHQIFGRSRCMVSVA